MASSALWLPIFVFVAGHPRYSYYIRAAITALCGVLWQLTATLPCPLTAPRRVAIPSYFSPPPPCRRHFASFPPGRNLIKRFLCQTFFCYSVSTATPDLPIFGYEVETMSYSTSLTWCSPSLRTLSLPKIPNVLYMYCADDFYGRYSWWTSLFSFK